MGYNLSAFFLIQFIGLQYISIYSPFIISLDSRPVSSRDTIGSYLVGTTYSIHYELWSLQSVSRSNQLDHVLFHCRASFSIERIGCRKSIVSPRVWHGCSFNIISNRDLSRNTQGVH